jgi:hypothetical protein
LVDVLKGRAKESDKDYDMDLVEAIVECEAEFADSPDESQRTIAKTKVRAIIQNHINK